jgi:6-phosphogluconolactonase
MRNRFHNYPGKTGLAEAAAAFVATKIDEAVSARGTCTVVLAGGSTPRDVYGLLAQAPYASSIPWGSVEVFFGDERCVPPDDSQSNFRMANESLLSRVPLLVGHIHRMRGEIEPERAAAEYAQELERVFGAGDPGFDLVLLGMGADGHTASLFPGTAAVAETRAPVAATWVTKLSSWRISLTFPALNSASTVMMLVSGLDKADTIARVFDAATPSPDLPVTLLNPRSGELHWFLDSDATSRLHGREKQKG